MQAKTMLLLAICLEVTGTAILKYFSVTNPLAGYLLVLLFITLSYLALSQAIRSIPISLAYAVWEGLGLTGTALIAWLLFGESLSARKILALTIILAGLVLIKKGTAAPAGGD